jgi:hypothetical protein
MEVTGIGIGSKSHHITHNMTMAPVQQALGSQPNVLIEKPSITARSGPKIKAQERIDNILKASVIK